MSLSFQEVHGARADHACRPSAGGMTIIACVIRDLNESDNHVSRLCLSVASGVSIGLCTIAVGTVVLLLWIPLRQRPGIGLRALKSLGAKNGAAAIAPAVQSGSITSAYDD
jgi:hypothetical protein